LNQLIEFWKLASRLKNEPRRGWFQRVKLEEIESVADHSFGVAILSLFEAERRGYDVGHVLELALVHDLEEAITGDLTPKDKRKLTPKIVSHRKRVAKERILANLPLRQRQRYQRIWNELVAGRTREARLVKDLDKLEMALQASYYESKGASTTEIKDFYRSARRAIKDGGLRKILGEVTEERN